jgi:hypothetical protein
MSGICGWLGAGVADAPQVIAGMAAALSRFDGSAVASVNFGSVAAAAAGPDTDVFQDDEQVVAVWGRARFSDAGLAELAQRNGIAHALAQGYARKRTDVFAALSGNFALAILDGRSGEAVLAIDRNYGNGDGAVEQQEWDGALKLMQTLNALVAVRVDGTQVTELWRITKGLPDVPSPLLYQNVLYLLKDGGILTSVNPDNGDVLRRERLKGAEGRYFASPVAGDGKVYCFG